MYEARGAAFKAPGTPPIPGASRLSVCVCVCRGPLRMRAFVVLGDRAPARGTLMGVHERVTG